MGFGGAAAAANAASKRNAALRGGRKFLNAAKTGPRGNQVGMQQTASGAVRKRLRERLRESMHRDRVRIQTTLVLLTILLLSVLIWWFV